MCLIGMCHEVNAGNLMANRTSNKAMSSVSSKLTNSKSSSKASKQGRKADVSKTEKTQQVEETVVLTQAQKVEVEEVKKLIEQNAPIFDVDGNCYNDMVSLPKGTYFRQGKEFKVE